MARVLTKKSFEKFIEEYTVTEETDDSKLDSILNGSEIKTVEVERKKLAWSKVKIAEYFGVSARTLYRWMHKSGFSFLIKDEPKQLERTRINRKKVS